MRIRLVLALLLPALTADSVLAQDWAKKMFAAASHDFGVVARGSKAEYAFELTNIYKEDVHVAAVRSSCGCTTVKIDKRELQTWEKSAVVAVFNTASFLGYKGATITVTLDRPFYAEVQLTVSGYIRGDVVFDPGEVNFSEVQQGAGAQTSVRVSYSGRSDWRIADVHSGNENFEVELSEQSRSAGRVVYDMIVRLKPETPAGYIQDQLTLVSDDRQMQTIPLAVAGRVLSPVTVSPPSLFLGVLKPGQSVTKKLLVRSKQAFKVLGVRCADEAFRFVTSEEVKDLHWIPVTFTASDKPGKMVQTIEIKTDLCDHVDCVATATVVADSE